MTRGVAIAAALALGVGEHAPPAAQDGPASKAVMPQGSQTSAIAAHPGMVDAASVVPALRVTLAYATAHNFIGEAVYGDLRQCFLQREAADMLAAAARSLAAVQPGLTLLAYDCARPVSVQRRMWQVVGGTPQQAYVANPDTALGSIHNYGCAVDLTIADADGEPLDMGTSFDFFARAAQPRHELDLLADGTLTHAQVRNRLLLRRVMVEGGFFPINNEWWHFNCLPRGGARRRFQKIP